MLVDGEQGCLRWSTSTQPVGLSTQFPLFTSQVLHCFTQENNLPQAVVWLDMWLETTMEWSLLSTISKELLISPNMGVWVRALATKRYLFISVDHELSYTFGSSSVDLSIILWCWNMLGVFSQKAKQKLESESECLLKINRDPPFDKSGIDTLSQNSRCDTPVCQQIVLLCIHVIVDWFYVAQRPVNDLYHVFVALLVLQGSTAVAPGMAGCAGTILQQEPMPPKTALIFFLTWTPQVSSEFLLCWCLVNFSWWTYVWSSVVPISWNKKWTRIVYYLLKSHWIKVWHTVLYL